MSRGYFRQSIWRRRDDAPFVAYRGHDETPDPACVPSADEVPAPSCPACGLTLTATDMVCSTLGVDDTPVAFYWCPRCVREVEGEYL